MKVSIEKSYAVRLYLPAACRNKTALAYLRKLAGGYTAYTQAAGVWDGPDQVFVERVNVYEANVVAGKRGMSAGELKRHVVEIGNLFMQDNPTELCFMARCVGDIIKLERTVH